MSERKKALEKVSLIVKQYFKTFSIDEDTKVNSFCCDDFLFVEFEILLQNEFNIGFDLSQDPKVGDVLDMICQS